jgi:hypothetical protein
MKVELTKDELGIINNALNEVCNGIDLVGEFDTRMGCTVEEARKLLAKIHTLASGQSALWPPICSLTLTSAISATNPCGQASMLRCLMCWDGHV